MNAEPESGSTPQQPPVNAYCRACGKGLTADEVVHYQGTIYCREHVPQTGPNPYTAPPPAAPASAGTISPGLAFVLGFIPGVGAIYNGQYAKGFLHVLITGVIFSLTEGRGGMEFFAPFMIPAWFLYMAFEAYHTARKRLLGEPVDEFSSILPSRAAEGTSAAVPVLLIGLGVVLLLHQLELIDLYRVRRYIAPAILIGVGLVMLYGRLKGNGGQDSGLPSGEMYHERN
jgi:hypothetical protein